MRALSSMLRIGDKARGSRERSGVFHIIKERIYTEIGRSISVRDWCEKSEMTNIPYLNLVKRQGVLIAGA